MICIIEEMGDVLIKQEQDNTCDRFLSAKQTELFSSPLSIVIKNESESVMITCTTPRLLAARSEYFRELILNISEEESSTLTCEEEDVFAASGLLLETLKRASRKFVVWNSSYARMAGVVWFLC